MTTWLAGEPGQYTPPGYVRGYLPPEADLAAYRSAVADLIASFERSGAADSPRLAARILARRLADPDIAAVAEHTPQGSAGALERLLAEVHGHRPCSRGPSLTALLR